MKKPECKIIYGDTDSLYIEYDSLLQSIEGYETMSLTRKAQIVAGLYEKFMNQHNFDYIKAYYDTRHCHSIHEFELETISASGIWTDKKKKYAQLLIYKDGKYYDEDNLHWKSKGLETGKASAPSLSRSMLQELIEYLLRSDDIDNSEKGQYMILRKLNAYFEQWQKAPINETAIHINVHEYSKYMTDGPEMVTKGAPYNVKGLLIYNLFVSKHPELKFPPTTSGKCCCYQYMPSPTDKSKILGDSITFPPEIDFELIKKYFSPNNQEMFYKYVVSPINRIIEPVFGFAVNADMTITKTLF